MADASYKRTRDVDLVFDLAFLLFSHHLFQTFARASVVGGFAAHQWIDDLLVYDQTTNSIPELEPITHET